MLRQGKYTKRVTPAQQAKRKVTQRFRWWRQLSWKKRLLYVGGPILALLIIIPIATYLYFARDISDQERLMNRNNTGVVLYANDGKTEIFSTGRAKHRELIPLDKISDSTEKALLSSEDKNFYEHGGFSVTSILGATVANITSGGSNYGGSTITQQLAKNTLLSSQKSFLRKFQELSVSVAIEQTYSKDEILSMYLNSVFFGGNVFGIEDAARTYYNKAPADLTLGESAMLIGILPSPNNYSPLYGSMELAKQRQNTVLSRMVDNKVITEDEKAAALAEVLPLQPVKELADDSDAPHFTEMVMKQLYDKYGVEDVTRSGYQVTTSLDMNVQTQLEAAVAANMPTITRNGGSNASAVAIDPGTGEIRGLVGSYDWTNEGFGKVNMVTTPRQPGSSFKPIYYTQALADGTVTPATILKDQKTDFGGGYSPNNADRRFRGNVTVRQALDWSLNIPAIEVLQKVGIDTTIQTAKRMGITTIDENKNYGLALALGTAEAPLLEMTNAYAAYANGGQQYASTSIKSINSKYDTKVFTAKETAKQVISEQGAYLISNILSDNATRSSVFGSSLNVYDGKTRAVKKAAVKTGTTDDSRDAWTIGYTPQIAIGVWVGNNDNKQMLNGGSIMAGPIWTKAMGNILAGVQTDFPMAPGIVQKNVCRSNGGLADTATSATYPEYFLSTNLPTTSCTVKPNDVKADEKKEDEQEADQPAETTTSLSVGPSGGSTAGSAVTLTATISVPGITGTVTFKDGATTLGTAQINGSVSASFTTTTLLPGTRVLSAEFTPSDTDRYESSSSDTVSYTVTAQSSGGSGTGGGNGAGQSGGATTPRNR